MTLPNFLWKLDENHNVVPATKAEVDALIDPDNRLRRTVAFNEIGKWRINTIFLPISAVQNKHFETGVWQGHLEGINVVAHYETWKEARDGHEKVCSEIREQETQVPPA